MTLYIYALTEPTGEIRYVGKAANLVKRKSDHIYEARTYSASPTWKNNWVNSLLDQGLRPEIICLEEVDEDNWREREKFWIAHMKELGCRLTNATEGGEGGFTGTEAMEKVWAKTRGCKRSDETRARMSKAGLGKPKTAEHAKNISLGLKGNTAGAAGKKGSENVTAKLTDEQVVEMRLLSAQGASNKELAAMYNITTVNVWYVVTRRTWKHL